MQTWSAFSFLVCKSSYFRHSQSEDAPNSIIMPVLGYDMGECSSCGRDLPGYEQLCRQCYGAQYAASTVPRGSSSYGWSTYMHLVLWIFVSYAFFTYMPDFVKLVVLLVGLVVTWYLFLWAKSKKPRKNYATPPLRLSFILGLCCGVVWKITGVDVWGRLGIACIFVCAVYRDVYRVIDRRRDFET